MSALTPSVPSGTETQKSWLVRGVMAVAAIGVLALVLPIVYFAFLSTLGLIFYAFAAVSVGLINAFSLIPA